jgi:hypothetical protein
MCGSSYQEKFYNGRVGYGPLVVQDVSVYYKKLFLVLPFANMVEDLDGEDAIDQFDALPLA